MKHIYPLLRLFALLGLILFFSGCSKEKEKDDMVKITLSYPVFESKTNVLASIKSESPRELGAPGKIFIYGKYLFINEIDKGVHIFDNSDANKPKAVAFINIPGNLDIGVKGTTLFADMYGDLVTVDISEPLNARLINSIPHIFPERNYYYDSTMIVVGWKEKDTLVPRGGIWYDCFNCQTAEFALANSSDKAAAGGAPGVAGSMARIAIVNDYLYTVNHSNLGVFDIHSPANPVRKNDQGIGWSIETIYPFRDKLFIGSASGMFIYDITNPEQPQRQSEFNHARACDPVVADEDYAFVTLRSGNTCAGFNNQLDVINVKDIFNPLLVCTYGMTNPHGLAKDGDLLFICDGPDGVKVFNAENLRNLKKIKQFGGMTAYDAIAWNNRLLVVAKEGLYQYDYSDSSNITQLSVIRSVNRPWWLK